MKDVGGWLGDGKILRDADELSRCTKSTPDGGQQFITFF
ncbi:hypothetical protein CBM2606_A180015 [Cupriavidus taiwanensis]|nr:hypothetical protein CBM2606_A180015 [Cupriavidus taiwanensis]